MATIAGVGGGVGVLTRLAAFARRHPDATSVVGLALLPVLVMGRALWPGRVLSPADILLAFPPWSSLAPGIRVSNPLLTDVMSMFHPWLIWASREIRAGHFPLWNPYTFAGAPFFANPQTALLFPLTWLALVLPPTIAITLIAIFKLSLAGVGMYWFLRLLALRPLAAALGALAFMLNGALITWLQWPVGTAMATLPWLFAMTERLRQRPTTASIAWLALAIAGAIFGGYLQTTTLAILLAGLWAVTRASRAERPAAFLAYWGVGAGLGLLLAAVQLLPFLEYTRHSSVYFYRSQWMPVMSAPARSAIALLLPYYFGSPTGRDFWGYWNFNEIAATVGIVPWLAVPAALVARWRQGKTLFFVAMAAVATVLCYDTPGVTETLGRVPPLSLVITYRLVAFLTFALSALAAIGMDALLAAAPGEARRLRQVVRASAIVLIAATFALVASDYPAVAHTTLRISPFVQYLVFLALVVAAAVAALGLSRSILGPAAILLTAQLASTLPLATTYNPVIDTARFYPAPPPAVRHAQAATSREPGRVVFALGKNLGMVYGLSEITGYDGMTPFRIEQLVSPIVSTGLNVIASGSINVTVGYASPVLDLLGVRRIIVPREIGVFAPHLVTDYDGPDSRVWLNPRALPRAFLVPRARCVDDPTALKLMHEGKVDFRTEVLIQDCAPLGRTDSPGGAGRALITEAAAERVIITTESDAGAWLVLADTWFPGWHVRIDGAVATVWRADYTLRAVLVPPGRHRVEWRYEPASFYWGLALSGAAVGGLAAIGVSAWRRRSA